jgi:hypothetical protein
MEENRTFRGAIIENEVAYQAAIHRNIINNAKKTWRKNNADTCEAIEAFISEGRHENKHGYYYDANFVGSLAKAFDTYGKLSDKQCQAVVSSIAKREEKRQAWVKAVEEQKSRSEFLGVANEKITGRALVEAVIIVDAAKFSYYDSASAFVYIMRDTLGNKIIYKSKNRLEYKFKYNKKCLELFSNITKEGNVTVSWDDAFIDIKAGMTIDFSATIKCHTESKGEKQTIVQRMKVSGLEYTEGKLKEEIDKRS